MKRPSLLAVLAIACLPMPALAQTAAPGAPPLSTTVPPAKMAAPMATPGLATAVTTAAPATLDANQFASDSTAKAKCPADTVVWVNNKSHKYFLSDARYYGKTKRGGYMCQKDADAAGDKMAGSLKKKKDVAKS